MREHTTWTSHAFTLAVFAGIVILCSIFFVLGMLVGRTQGYKIASTAAEAAVQDAARPEANDSETPELTFYETVENNRPVPLEPSSTSPRNVVNFQVGALRQSVDAERLLDELEGKGFHGFILAPAPGDPNPLFRVQAGPYADDEEVQTVKRRLESAGYEPIIRR